MQGQTTLFDTLTATIDLSPLPYSPARTGRHSTALFVFRSLVGAILALYYNDDVAGVVIAHR